MAENAKIIFIDLIKFSYCYKNESLMNKINDSYNVNFTSLKPQKRLGEKVLREFESEMGYLKSSSNLGLRLEKDRSILRKNLYENLLKKNTKLDCEIYDSFICKKISNKKFKSIDDFKRRLIKNIKRKGNKANCWEDMMIVFAKLLEKGEKPQNFQVIVCNNKGSLANHFSTVIGLKKNAKIDDPTTWGTKALIVDAWAKMVKPASEGLEDIKEILSMNSTIKSVKYSKTPSVSIKECEIY